MTPGLQVAYAERVAGRVLVIDDEPMVAQCVARALAPHAVTVTGGAREALALLTAGERFEVIVCDLVMPGMSGMDLYFAILRSDPRQAAAMIFLTGGPDPNDPEMCAFYEAPP